MAIPIAGSAVRHRIGFKPLIGIHPLEGPSCDIALQEVAVRLTRELCVMLQGCSSAVPSDTAQTAPTMRDRHLQIIAERGRMAWQMVLFNQLGSHT